MQIDHLMWACSDLDAGIREIADLTGVEAVYAGSHDSLGTRNALLSLGDTYLEIIAPDPAQSLVNNFGGRLAKLESSGLLAFAMNRIDLAQLKLELSDFVTSDVRETQRTTSTGEVLIWQLLFVAKLEGAPFFIDWLDCVHPALTSPKGCELEELVIESADTENLTALTNGNGTPAKLTYRHEPGACEVKLYAKLNSPNGVVQLTPCEPIALF